MLILILCILREIMLILGTIKDRNGMNLTEGEDIKKRSLEYTEELYKKILTTQKTTMV